MLWVEVTLHFLEIAVHHLQPEVPQGIELPSFCVETLTLVGLGTV